MKKLPLFLSLTIAVASVMAVGGAGCSSTEVVVVPADVMVDGPVVDRVVPEAATEDAAPMCPLDTPPPDGSLPWKPPTPAQLACTFDDFNALDQYLKGSPNATTSDVEAFVKKRNAVCHDCIFTDAAKATWGPVPMENGQLLTINIGGCFSILAKSDACGQDIQNVFDCSYDSCALCEDATFEKCLTTAQKGICKPFVSKETDDCAGAPADVNDRCGSFIRSVRVQCVGEPDAGDASPD